MKGVPVIKTIAKTKSARGFNAVDYWKGVFPSSVITSLRRLKNGLFRYLVQRFVLRQKVLLTRFSVRELNQFGLNVASVTDYYSPLPVLIDLERRRDRWIRPSSLSGVHYDLTAMKGRLSYLLSKYSAEYSRFPAYNENLKLGYGPGFTSLDALVLYCTLREMKPKRYVEVGSGLSTYYCSLAANHNRDEGYPFDIQCIEPNPYEKLKSIPGIRLNQSEVQDVPISFFNQLEAGDVLFIDTSHSVKIDGDVPYLLLEVMPQLKPGVTIHIHDINFPYNIPYPAEFWTLGKKGRFIGMRQCSCKLCYVTAAGLKYECPRHFSGILTKTF